MSEIFDWIDAIIEDQRAIAVYIMLLFLFPMLSLFFNEPNKKKRIKGGSMRYSALLELSKEMAGSAEIQTIDKAKGEEVEFHIEMIIYTHPENILLLINKYFYNINNFYADKIVVGEEGDQTALAIIFDCRVKYDYK